MTCYTMRSIIFLRDKSSGRIHERTQKITSHEETQRWRQQEKIALALSLCSCHRALRLFVGGDFHVCLRVPLDYPCEK